MLRYVILLFLLANVAIAQEKRETAEALFEEGVKLQSRALHGEAITKFTRCLFVDARYVDAYAARASSKEQLSDLDGALTDLNSCLELRPDDYEVLLSRGALLFRVKRYGPAREDFLKLLRLPHGETNSVFYRKSAHSPGTDRIMTAQSGIKAQVYSYLGLIEVELSNCTQGIRYLDSAIRLDNQSADYYVNRALAKRACQDQSASDDFQMALRLDPDHAIARHNLAVESATRGQTDEAEAQFTEAISRDSTLSYTYIERGFYRLSRGNYSGALYDYDQALKLNPADPEVWLSRGIVKERLKDFDGAYSDYTHAINLQEDFVKAWLNRGNLFMKQGKYKEAIEEYSTALVYRPEYAVAYNNRAIAHFYNKQRKAACEDVSKAEELGFAVDKDHVHAFCDQAK